MSVTSGFFNSRNGDRRYSAEQFSELLNGLINDGVFANIGTAFSVSAADGNTVNVGVGRAWFNGIWIYNDAILPMPLRASEVLLNRIDALVIEVNRSESVRAASIRFVYGSPTTDPVKPELMNNDEVHQYPLAYIYRPAESTTVIQANITSMIGTSSCPFVTGILEVQSIDSIVAQWESEFETWFENLQTDLDGDVAVNLANRILEIENRFKTLAREKAVYEALQDSDGNTIQDSAGRDIEGRTILGGQSGSGDTTIHYEAQKDPFKIGDILTTQRTDLDSSWLLCNGTKLNRITYSKLGELSPFDFLDTSLWTRTQLWNESGSQNQGILEDVIYANGYYIAVGKHIEGSTYYARISYTTDPSGEWIHKDLWSGNTGDVSLSSIIYVNGQYVVLGTYNYSSTTSSKCKVRIAYSSDLAGNWTMKDIGSACYFAKTNKISFVNGYYVLTFVQRMTNSSSLIPYYYFSISLTAGFSARSLTTGQDSSAIGDILYVNGQYYAILYDGYNYSQRKLVIATSPSLEANLNSEGWVKTEIEDIYSQSFSEEPPRMYYDPRDGYFIVLAVGSDSGTTTRYAYEFKSLKPSISWSKTTLWSGTGTHKLLSMAINKYGYFRLGSYTNSYTTYSHGATSAINVPKKLDLRSSSNGAAVSLIDANNRLILFAAEDKGSNQPKVVMYEYDSGSFKLPSISVNSKTYTYIKALE